MLVKAIALTTETIERAPVTSGKYVNSDFICLLTTVAPGRIGHLEGGPVFDARWEAGSCEYGSADRGGLKLPG